ncbi:MAG: hypothetical protein CML51_07300, partial [Rhodobacteraceae bacterium]|nr:hypothetical protein [Paracoccaceae bacterium]
QAMNTLFLRHIYALSGWFYLKLIKSKISTHNATHNETSDQNRVNQGLLYLIANVELQDLGTGTPIPGPRVSDIGPLVLAL